MTEHTTTKKKKLQVSRHDRLWTSWGWTKSTSLKLGAHKFVCICVLYTTKSVKYTNDKPCDLKNKLFLKVSMRHQHLKKTD